MLKSNVGYSTNPDSFTAGIETAELTSKDLKNIKLGLLFTSVKNDIKEVLKEFVKLQIFQLLAAQVVVP